MSELIDNRKHRIDALKSMIHELHDGAEPAALKSRFRAVLDHVGPSEISVLESELMAEGMPQEEIRRMCELHVAVFRDKLEQLPTADQVPGHPVHTFRRENARISEIVAAYRGLVAELTGREAGLTAAHRARWRALQADLAPLDAHYKRKEFLVFPCLEKAGIVAPPKVMWGIDDKIRELCKAAAEAAAAGEVGAEDLRVIVEVVLTPLLDAVAGMVEKEDKILWPMALEHLSERDWAAVRDQWDEVGPGFVVPERGWEPSAAAPPAQRATVGAGESLALPSGNLSLDQLIAVLNTLPVDITFVDADDRVAYFSEGSERVFARHRAIIGRRVQDCHPPASLHIVQRIVDEMRAGTRDLAEFWISLGGRFVHIRYLAVRDPQRAYLGCLEVTQDVTAIRALEGERRLLAEAS